MASKNKGTTNSSTNSIESVELFHKEDKVIKSFPVDDAVFEMYYLRCRVPTAAELKTNSIKTDVKTIKERLSSKTSYLPLYDAFTYNLYIISKRNIYIRVVNHDYRFPDEQIIETIKKKQENMMNKIKKKPELKQDRAFMRRIHKADMMVEFMNQFDTEILYTTYLNIFFSYAPEIGNATYTCSRRSFVPHQSHLKPYYTRDEAIKLGMNMDIIKLSNNVSYADFKDSLTKSDYHDICSQIQTNDISAKILIRHQNYIIERNMVGLIQYYTVQGSYFMNQYMRGFTRYEYRNDYLEQHIVEMWKLVLRAPAFDNDYILYRFVSTDNFLKHLKIGDVFVEQGFMSTTRDPFYRNDLYKFGFVLLKIRVPKDVKGVGLCLETLSHFPYEEEIVLPPLVHLRLVSKDDDCKYYHPDESFVADIKTRYEFEWVKNGDIKFPDRPEYDEKTQIIDFLSITKENKIISMSVKEKADLLIKKYFDPMNRALCRIGEKTFYIVAEWYDSTGAYEDKYALKTADGFSLYSLHEGFMLFIIEVGEINGERQIRVNYSEKYVQFLRGTIIGDDHFIKFVSSIAHYFDVPNVLIYADFVSCDGFRSYSSSVQGPGPKPKPNSNPTLKSSLPLPVHGSLDMTTYPTCDQNICIFRPRHNKKQRNFIDSSFVNKKANTIAKLSSDASSQDKFENEFELEPDTDVYVGGSFSVDFYLYLKFGVKRYQKTDTLFVELQPVFSYHDLDVLKDISPSTVLKKQDRDEVYQIYMKNYRPEVLTSEDSMAKFYVWMVEHKCYLMDILVKKMDYIYKQNSPFRQSMYRLDAMCYLYNRKYINTYNRYIKMSFEGEEHQLLTLPKNEYRIRR